MLTLENVSWPCCNRKIYTITNSCNSIIKINHYVVNISHKILQGRRDYMWLLATGILPTYLKTGKSDCDRPGGSSALYN